MTSLGHAKVGSKGQVTIPKKVQEVLGGLDSGDYIIFYREGKNIYIKKGKVNPIN
jgi:AbrB family looped-hinge helix DNA binding protein